MVTTQISEIRFKALCFGTFFEKSGLDLFFINLEIGHFINVQKVKKKVKAYKRNYKYIN
jgi:hypothetical protein